MKINITIILGFLGSGKTNFINSMIKNNYYLNKKLVIIQDEFGQSQLNTKSLNYININAGSESEFNSSFINNVINKYSPNEMIIEANGIKDPEYIFSLFSSDKKYQIDNIITLIDIPKFELYFSNLKNIFTNSIFYADTIILNNLDNINKKDFFQLKKKIRKINETADIVKPYNSYSNASVQENYCNIENNNFSFFKNLFFICIFLFLFTFITTISIMTMNISSYINIFQKFKLTFISLIIESIPFILFGSLISSIIQIYISQDTLLKIFSKNTFLSLLIAAFLGLILPICDCGTIPIVKSMINKKIPIGAAITFLLAAPIVNPISIISTIYAFQNNKIAAFYRVFYGIIIAVCVGFIMNHFSLKDNSIIINNEMNCTCCFCNDKLSLKGSKIKTLSAAFSHTFNEFFNTSKYMITGAFLSSVFQNVISLNNNFIPNDNITGLIFMIILSFFLSVCSTSDAFIARTFLNSFSLNSVMGFLVVGPMLDIKNTIMLFGNFNKKFTARLIFFILLISFSVLIIFRF